MASEDHTYHPKDALKSATQGALVLGTGGFVIAATSNTLSKTNYGAWGWITRGGGTIANFTGAGAGFMFARDVAANLRQKDDSYNHAIGGFVAGAIAGLRTGSAPKVLGMGAGLAIVFAAYEFTGGRLRGPKRDPEVDEFERKQQLRKNRRIPIEETIAQLGEGRGIYAPGYDERRKQRIKENYGIDVPARSSQSYFQETCTEILDQISQLGSHSVVGGERKDAADHLLAAISRLSNDVADLSGFIPPYDQRVYSQAIKGLSEKFQETKAKLEPKPRFAFKTAHKNHSAVSVEDAAELAKQSQSNAEAVSSNESSQVATPAVAPTPPSEPRDTIGDLPSFPSKNYNAELGQMPGGGGPIRKPSFSQASTVAISGHTGLHIILPSSASRATASGSLTSLKRCIVDMSVPTANGAPFAGLALKNIKQSLVIAGRVAGAAHITGIEDSIIVVDSRQVRMHDCKNVDIYLQCASRPIIEDCNNVRFSPIPECHRSTSAEYENQWDQVDDFKWLKSEHSPNWSTLPEGSRLDEGAWTDIVPGGPGVGLEDIFKKIGIPAQ
ncbi:hypothetical protein HYFRA_00005769 [Hymenoscyphus fraxineus]|uniref:C-CAP/cofactor C-like domain-containing protein n=1 Tax=Hymenoscyphus fraxineus TaxID=746836 RepID=A0A9N9KW22_9HELO|nr:hypothetical protein HYFRA_00005769 [Hymenoscyphus fraxineus]